MLPNFFLDSRTSGQKAGGDDDSGFCLVIQGVDDVLQKHQINIHTTLFLLGNVWHTSKETLLVFFSCQRLPVITEIHIEWRITDDIVEFG